MQFRIVNLNVGQIRGRDADRFGEAGFCLNGSGARDGEIGLHANLTHLNRQQFACGDGAGRKALFEESKQRGFMRDLIGQEFFALARGPKFDDSGVDVAADLPGGGHDGKSRGDRELLRFELTFAALAGCFDGQIDRGAGNPWIGRSDGAEIVPGRKRQRWIRPGAGGDFSSGGSLALDPRELKAGLVKHCGERQRIDIPICDWRRLICQMRGDESLQIGIGQRTAV